ncbi:MAG: tetratricopeptide repeat protein, partial [candidate division KSB1 bacterium]|nr:tetratricopeptide repeat protein [candidate division KSB1 bacterium]
TGSYAQEKASDWFQKGAQASDLDQQIACYQKAIELDPSYTEAYYNLGFAYERKGQLDKALQSFGRALLSRPNKLDSELRLKIVYELGIIYKKSGRYEEARESLSGALNLASKDETKIDILFQLGQVNVRLGAYDEAINQFKEALRLKPQNASQLNEAIKEAQRLKEIDSYYQAGVNYIQNRAFQKAITALEKVLELDANFKDAQQKLNQAKEGLLAQQKNEQEWQRIQSQELVTEPIKFQNLEKNFAPAEESKKIEAPQQLEALYTQGLTYLENKNWEQAISAFERLLSLSPDYKETTRWLDQARKGLEYDLRAHLLIQYYNEGLAEFRKRDWVQAIIAFEKVRNIDPNYRDVAEKLRQAQRRLDQEGEEVAKLRYYNQGMLAIKKNDWINAVTLFERLVEIDPDYKDARQRLEEARAVLENKIVSSEAVQLYNEGMNWLAQKEWLKALIAFEKARILAPEYKDIQDKLVEARTELKRKEEALLEEQKVKQRKKIIWVLMGAVLTLVVVPVVGVFVFLPSIKAQLYLALGKKEKASQLYEHLLATGNVSDKLCLSLCNLYLLENRRDEAAIKLYERVLRLNLIPEAQKKDELSTIVTQYYVNKWRIDTRAIEAVIEEALNKETSEVNEVTSVPVEPPGGQADLAPDSNNSQTEGSGYSS